MKENVYQMYSDNKYLDNYKSVAGDMLQLYFPLLSKDEINVALDWSISKRLQDTPVQVDNNYKRQTIDTTLLEMAKYIMDRQPIITAYGVMFKRHGEVPNPIYEMVDNFIKTRKLHKKEMFKYPKGSEMFEKFNLLQALDRFCPAGRRLSVISTS